MRLIGYLFNEWVGKSAVLVTCGGHGGHNCFDQLKQVLNGLDMEVSKKGVLIPFPTKKEIVHGIPADHYDQIPRIREDILDFFQILAHQLVDLMAA